MFGDLSGKDFRWRQVVGVFEALVSQPEYVEAGLVTGDQLVVAVALEPIRLRAFVAGV